MTARRLRSYPNALATGLRAAPSQSAYQAGLELPGDLTSHASSLVDGLTDDAVAMLNTDGVVTGWTRAAQTMTGYGQTEILGQHISVFYTAEDRRRNEARRHLHRAAEEGTHRCEGWRLRKNGTPFSARVALQAVSRADGAIGGFMMVIRDIGEHQELIALRDDRDRARKFEAIGRLTGGMTSELIGVMTEIGASHDIALQCAADEAALEALASGRQANLQGRKLLSQLRGFVGRAPAARQAANLNDLVASMDALLASAIGANFDLRLCLGAPNLTAMVDPAEFQLILLEMALCARAELPHGGVVTVFVESQPKPGTQPRAASPGESNAVLIGVSTIGHDTGDAQRDPQRVPRCADDPAGSFFQASLSQWDRFARRAGGHLKLETVPGQRINYAMYLPALGLSAAACDAGKDARTILLVDDDANVLSLVSEMLAYLGHKVVAAQDGSEALAHLSADRSIDVLFTDIVLPTGMNGLQLMQAARSARPGLRTALASVRSRDDLLELGGIPQDVVFFAKPYALADVNAYLVAA
jgi:PAS domain S-box-containing protein